MPSRSEKIFNCFLGADVSKSGKKFFIAKNQRQPEQLLIRLSFLCFRAERTLCDSVKWVCVCVWVILGRKEKRETSGAWWRRCRDEGKRESSSQQDMLDLHKIDGALAFFAVLGGWTGNRERQRNEGRQKIWDDGDEEKVLYL